MHTTAYGGNGFNPKTQHEALGTGSIGVRHDRQAQACAAMPMRDVSPVESALDSLSREVEEATTQVEELAQRLAFVSDTNASGSSIDGESPSVSAIESRIYNITTQVSRIANQLADMRAALRI